MYPDSESRSHKLYDRALKSLPGGNTRTTVFMKPYPIYAARGEGCRVWDVDGNEYIDCINNFTSLIHGYAHPVLIEAATRQLALGSAFGLPTLSEKPTQIFLPAGAHVPKNRSHHAIRCSASPQLDREGNGRSHASHLLFANPQFQPRFFARHLRHTGPPDRAGRSHPGACRRATLGDARGRGAVQGRPARRRYSAQRSLSWRQPSA